MDGKITVRTPGGVGVPKPGNCVYAYENGEISEEMLNPSNAFEVAFTTPNFAPVDFVQPEGPDVGEGPSGGGENEFEGPTGGGGEPTTTGGDELGIGSTQQQDPPMMMMEDPPMMMDEDPPMEEDEQVEF